MCSYVLHSVFITVGVLDGFCWRVVVGAGVGSPSAMGDPVGALVGVTIGVLVGTLVSEFVCSF
jgi:hypothetical protein